jgi:hypothetical protein
MESSRIRSAARQSGRRAACSLVSGQGRSQVGDDLTEDRPRARASTYLSSLTPSVSPTYTAAIAARSAAALSPVSVARLLREAAASFESFFESFAFKMG